MSIKQRLQNLFLQEVRSPAIGSKWALYPGNPFPSACLVTITAVKNRYVEYCYGSGNFSSCSIQAFRNMYTEIK